MTNWTEVAAQLGYPSEVEMWKTLYAKQKLSLSRLAARFSCTPQTIRERLRRSLVPKRKRGGASSGVSLKRSEAKRLKAEGLGPAARRHSVPYDNLYQRD